jgi:hypothetical protein
MKLKQFAAKFLLASVLLAGITSTPLVPVAHAQLIVQGQASPQAQALAARQGLNDSILHQIASMNAQLIARYNEATFQWQQNKNQQKVGTALTPIPVPPASYVPVRHVNTAREALYDAMFPGLPQMIDDVQNGPPVAPQYVEPQAPVAPPPGTILHIGQALLNGEWAAMPDDNMPVNYLTKAPDGSLVRKVVKATPWGTAAWYAPAQ